MSEAAQVTAYSRIKMVDVTARLIASANCTSKQPTKSGAGRKKRPALGGARWVAAAAILATLATLTLPTTSAALLGCNACNRCNAYNAYNAYNVCNTPWARAQCSPNRSRLAHASHSCQRGQTPNARGNPKAPPALRWIASGLAQYGRVPRGVLTGYSRGTHGVLTGYSRGTRSGGAYYSLTGAHASA